MIATRSAQSSTFCGFNVLHLFGEPSDASSLAHTVFNNFDNALLKLRNDPDSTKANVVGLAKAAYANRLNTARVAALKSLPERHRNGACLYLIFIGKSEIWSFVPGWIRFYEESPDGALSEFRSTSGPKPSWAHTDYSHSESAKAIFHLRTFGEFSRLDLATSQDFDVSRSATTLTKATKFGIIPSMALMLEL